MSPLLRPAEGLTRIGGLSDFESVKQAAAAKWERFTAIEAKLALAPQSGLAWRFWSQSPIPFRVVGYSHPAQQAVEFQCLRTRDFVVNWRESLVCPRTALSNRKRLLHHVLLEELAPPSDADILVCESGIFAEQLRHSFPKIIESEYTGEIAAPAETHHAWKMENLRLCRRAVRHEDLTRLSFQDESLDCLIHSDVLEHIPNFSLAYRETFRVLRPNGAMLWTVPFVSSSASNIIRARLNGGGDVEHILPPEYHGDPLKPSGILCYTHFGWEMLEQLREIGFKDVYCIHARSIEWGYLGGGNLCFIAVK